MKFEEYLEEMKKLEDFPKKKKFKDGDKVIIQSGDGKTLFIGTVKISDDNDYSVMIDKPLNGKWNKKLWKKGDGISLGVNDKDEPDLETVRAYKG